MSTKILIVTQNLLTGLLSRLIGIVGTGAEWEGNTESQHTSSKSTSSGQRRKKVNAWINTVKEKVKRKHLARKKNEGVSFDLDYDGVLSDVLDLHNREFAEIGYRQVIAILTAQELEDVDLIGVAMTEVAEDHESAFAGLIVACGSLISLSKTLKTSVDENLDLRELLMEMRADNLKEIHIAKAVDSFELPEE